MQNALTLYVYPDVIESYKNAFLWTNFGSIVALTNEETGIDPSTLNSHPST
ncbi:MAG: hypothetical protein IKT86_03260 [Bacteroidaceae bacterium]|nr:hypothetical protein [Bacteroidaceae bacterium]